MIKDSRAEFCAATALSLAATGLTLVGNVMDITKVRDIGNGRQAYLVIQVTTTVTSGGAATLEFDFVSDAVAALHVDGTSIVHAKSAAFAMATLVAGFQVIIPVPWQLPAYKQFIGILQNVGGFVLTAGAINAFLVLDPAAAPTYPAATS